MFKFRLQRLLELRELREREAAAALTRAEAARDAARSALEELASVRRDNHARLLAAHAERGTVGELRNLAFVLEQLDRQVADAERQVGAAEAEAATLRQDLTVAHVDRRAIDKLRERDQSTWRDAAAQADRALMDDIALSRFVRRTTPPASATPGEA